MYYTTSDNKKVLDGMAGLWCVNAGHCRPRIVKAVQDQVAEMDYSTAFNMGHPKAFTLANKLADILPKDIVSQIGYVRIGRFNIRMDIYDRIYFELKRDKNSLQLVVLSAPFLNL